MGTEILYPIGIAVKWCLISFLSLICVYTLVAAAFRKHGASWLGVLLSLIFYPYAALLFLPSGFYVLTLPFVLFGMLSGGITPLSDAIISSVLYLGIGGVLAAIWWGAIVLFSRLEKFSQPDQSRLEDKNSLVP